MTHIKVVDNIKLHHSKGLISKDSSGKWVPTHYQQGKLDGACAVYSLIMNLLILGEISQEDINIHNPIDKRTRKGKFLSHFLEDQGLIRNGYYFKSLAKEIRDYSNISATQKLPKSNVDAINIIQECIDADLPIIISISSSEYCHAILVIGIEYDNNNIPKKILCLDPDDNAPICAQWNSFLDISNSTYWHKSINNKAQKIEIGDMIIISPKEKE